MHYKGLDLDVCGDELFLAVMLWPDNLGNDTFEHVLYQHLTDSGRNVSCCSMHLVSDVEAWFRCGAACDAAGVARLKAYYDTILLMGCVFAIDVCVSVTGRGFVRRDGMRDHVDSVGCWDDFVRSLAE